MMINDGHMNWLAAGHMAVTGPRAPLGHGGIRIDDLRCIQARHTSLRDSQAPGWTIDPPPAGNYGLNYPASQLMNESVAKKKEQLIHFGGENPLLAIFQVAWPLLRLSWCYYMFIGNSELVTKQTHPKQTTWFCLTATSMVLGEWYSRLLSWSPIALDCHELSNPTNKRFQHVLKYQRQSNNNMRWA